jgi:hypothetical protein
MNSSNAADSDAVVPPSTFFVFWPGDEPPTGEEIRCRLADWGQPGPAAEEAGAEDVLWSFWFELGDRPVSYLLWCEPVAGPHLKLLDLVAFRDEEQERLTRSCRWVVGLEGPLSLRHPAVDYQLQLKIADAISRDWAPVVYDASALQFRTAGQTKQIIGSRTPPRTSSFYTVHRVRAVSTAASPRNAVERYWLHTHGLQRVGVPDLELFDVTPTLVPAALELIETVASLWIQYQTPEPEAPFAVGQGLEVSWRPWQAVAAELSSDASGGWHHRKDEFAHVGYRAVLTAPRPLTQNGAGAPTRLWTPPRDALLQITRPETTLFRSLYETRRMASLAHERWSDFGMLFASRRSSNWRFAVKLRYGDEDGGQCEHLWFEVHGVRPGRVQAKLLSTPTFVEHAELTELQWHDLSRLSDWRILTNRGSFDPENADVLFDLASFANEPVGAAP